jgi:hypothetical protein
MIFFLMLISVFTIIEYQHVSVHDIAIFYFEIHSGIFYPLCSIHNDSHVFQTFIKVNSEMREIHFLYLKYIKIE